MGGKIRIVVKTKQKISTGEKLTIKFALRKSKRKRGQA